MWFKKKKVRLHVFFLFSIPFQFQFIILPVQLHISQAKLAQIAVGSCNLTVILANSKHT